MDQPLYRSRSDGQIDLPLTLCVVGITRVTLALTFKIKLTPWHHSLRLHHSNLLSVSKQQSTLTSENLEIQTRVCWVCSVNDYSAPRKASHFSGRSKTTWNLNSSKEKGNIFLLEHTTKFNLLNFSFRLGNIKFWVVRPWSFLNLRTLKLFTFSLGHSMTQKLNC